MEEELLRQILREIQSQSGTSWLDFLQLMIPAIVGLVAGILGAGVGIYSVKRSSDSQLETLRLTTKAEVDKISLERRLDLRRDRYMELQDALAEYIAALNSMLEAIRNQAGAVFKGDEQNEELYATIYGSCREKFESVRSSGRLSKSRLKIADQEIGNLVRALAEDSLKQIVAITGYAMETVEEFRKSGTTPGSGTSYWPEEHSGQLANILRRTHEVNEMIEERSSLTP